VRALPPRLSVGYRTFGSNLLMSAELVPIAAISQILPKIVPRHDQPRLFAVAELIDRAQISSDAEEKTWKLKVIA
jgi:hypothetical protein